MMAAVADLAVEEEGHFDSTFTCARLVEELPQIPRDDPTCIHVSHPFVDGCLELAEFLSIFDG